MYNIYISLCVGGVVVLVGKNEIIKKKKRSFPFFVAKKKKLSSWFAVSINGATHRDPYC